MHKFNSYPEYILTKDELLTFNCLKCSRNPKKHLNKYLIKRLANTYKFCDGDIKLYLMLRKGLIHTNTWIAGKDLMKHRYLIKKIFTVI